MDHLQAGGLFLTVDARGLTEMKGPGTHPRHRHPTRGRPCPPIRPAARPLHRPGPPRPVPAETRPGPEPGSLTNRLTFALERRCIVDG